MTIICCNREAMAADTQYSDDVGGGLIHVKKIYKLKNGNLVGLAGDGDECNKARKWLEDRRRKRPKKLKTVEIILLEKKTGRMLYSGPDCIFDNVVGDYACIGSGGDVASGVLESGGDLRQAVLTACELNAYCGVKNGEVDYRELD